jgi:hypothetical protein
MGNAWHDGCARRDGAVEGAGPSAAATTLCKAGVAGAFCAWRKSGSSARWLAARGGDNHSAEPRAGLSSLGSAPGRPGGLRERDSSSHACCCQPTAYESAHASRWARRAVDVDPSQGYRTGPDCHVRVPGPELSSGSAFACSGFDAFHDPDFSGTFGAWPAREGVLARIPTLAKRGTSRAGAGAVGERYAGASAVVSTWAR